MRARVLSAAVLVPVVAAVFLLGTPWITLGVAVVALLAAAETFRLLRAAGLPVSPGIGIIGAPVAVLGTLIPDPQGTLAIAFVTAVLILAAVAAFRHRDTKTAFLDWAGSSFGALYVSAMAFVPALLFVEAPLRDRPPPLDRLQDGQVWILILVLAVWTFDTSAYLAGRFHGRGRFMNHISPSKTWSGVIGGTVAAVVVTTALVSLVGHHPLWGAFLGLLIAITGQAGDVAESMLKRAAGAKDSGSILPGHGGVLDRVDSFLFAAPALYVALAAFAMVGRTQ